VGSSAVFRVELVNDLADSGVMRDKTRFAMGALRGLS
jgi:hypothetical protein